MRRRYNFIGHVQGVGFRATARVIAHNFPVTGWVRNEPDRSVTLEVQGEPRDLDAYMAELRRAMHRGIERSDESSIAEVPGEATFLVKR